METCAIKNVLAGLQGIHRLPSLWTAHRTRSTMAHVQSDQGNCWHQADQSVLVRAAVDQEWPLVHQWKTWPTQPIQVADARGGGILNEPQDTDRMGASLSTAQSDAH